jgi:outer membrane receptor protein involved in Fe transport
MFKRTKISTAAAIAVGGAVVGAFGVQNAWAQQTLEAVSVTGTRIQTPGTISNSPISSVGAEEIKAGQPVVVEEFFKSLPAAVPAIGSATNNGTAGGATIDLRGIGANRTLVLLDGRRMVPFDLTGAVDTNSIPIALLQRVDLVTGGVSAVYGADAIAGVVNFVLRKDFRGVDLTTSYGTSGQNDAKRTRTDFTMGAGTDDHRGNVALSVGYTKTDPLLQGDRSFGQVSRNSKTGNPQGSFTTVPVFEGGNLGQMDVATGLFDPNSANTFNFNPLNYYQTPLERTQITALGNYSINNNAEFYTLLTFTRSDVGSQLAPSGTFFNDYNVPLGNPYLPAGARAQICADKGFTAPQCADNNQQALLSLGRRFVELGPRENNFENTSSNSTIGLRGDLPYAKDWTYDVYASTGRSSQVQTRVNWGSSSKVQQALLALDPTACIDPSNGCVPLNIFGAEGSITPAMGKFINLDALLLQNVEQKVFSGAITGDLGALRSPLAKAPIGAALGAEYRKLTASNKSDAASQINGEVLGTGAATIDRAGEFTLKEIFGELVIPVLSDMPAARRLNLELGYRQSQFSSSASTSYGTYKVGGDWEPTQGFRIRAMAQRATRAPNVDELYQPLTTGLDNLAVDPCQGASINAAQANTPGTLSNLCRLTGVPVNSIGTLPAPSAGQINVLTGGNPNLQPEKADTGTLGFVWQPSKGLGITVDYYNIAVDDAVSTPAVDDVINGCYAVAGNPTLALNAACAAVGRNPNTGTFNGANARGVALPQSNLGKIRTSGYDVGVNYATGLNAFGVDSSWGKIDASLNVTFVDTYNYQATPNAVNRKCVGYYSVACGSVSAGEGPIYKTKWNQRTGWSVNDFVFSYNWRHVSGVTEEPGGTNFLPAYSTIDSYDWFDFAMVYNMNKNLRFNLSINNVFDKKPPEVGNTIGTTSANSGNTFPQSYDVIGRQFIVGASLKF